MGFLIFLLSPPKFWELPHAWLSTGLGIELRALSMQANTLATKSDPQALCFITQHHTAILF